MTEATTRPEPHVSGQASLRTEGGRSDAAEPGPSPEPVVLEDLLVEDVSIDGMCGVY